ncbi:MAG: hypothetical protein CMM15_16280 [Rhodospirillaceae bacterium]|nr:hypothetical protein [Rhodospirillaceae bacterium]
MFSILLFLIYLYWEKLTLCYEYFKMSWKKNDSLTKSDKFRTFQLVVIEACQLFGEYALVFLDLHRGRLKISKVSTGKIDIEYPYCGRNYVFRTQIKKGPRKFLVEKVVDEAENDITDTVRRYLGPNEDWHGNTYSVQDFGCSSMEFLLTDERRVHFEDNLGAIE